ncbi:MAG TPA: hypothetical protein DDX93_04700 [Smithella sp.]|jgi:hypothetical protein|nr:hypothetical protein [Candidatus Omnitrophota bacterium]HBI48000.1 hypothetical protein [Smithella sp.]
MHPKLVKSITEYLQSVLDFDPMINPQKMGQCLYCGVALDEGKKHRPDCHYLEAEKLLKEFKTNE